MISDSSREHRRQASSRGPVSVGVITVSDSRTADSDVNGEYLRHAIGEAGHRAAGYEIVPDDPEPLLEALRRMTDSAEIVIINGGTGISPRDRTYDVLERTLEKRLPGFGELFRMLSFEQVGAAAMLSRATAGLYRGRVIFSVPGSPAAVQLAWERLIEPELTHLVWDLGRG